ncbi:MAG: ABC transporter substrate-binding protein, partial [Burkholderiales bacterium]
MPQRLDHSMLYAARVAIALLLHGYLFAAPQSAFAQNPPATAAKPKSAAQRPVVVAQVVPLSGPLAAVGRDVSDATQAYIDSLNRAGGIGGRMVELVIADDGNDPKRSTAATLDLILQHEPVAFVNCFGTVGCMAQVDALRASGIPMIGPIAGAPSLRTREQRHVFSIRPDAASEVRVLAEHLRSIGSPPITVVYQDDGFGRSYLPFAERVLQEYGMAIERVVRIVPEKPDYAGAAKTVGTGSKAVLLLANVTHSVGVLRALSAVGVEPLAFNLAAQANADFINRMTGTWTYSVFATFTPSPWRRALASAR